MAQRVAGFESDSGTGSYSGSSGSPSDSAVKFVTTDGLACNAGDLISESE